MDMVTMDQPARAQTFELAKPIIERPNVFDAVVEIMAGRGFVGDPRQLELLYAVFASRLLHRPMCAFIKAPSSSGKSWLLNRTLEMFPEESYGVKSGFSPKAIAYGRSDLRHKILVVQESSGLNGREGNMLVRTLISEGCIRWEVAGRQRDGFASRVIERPGPIAFVMTTTHDTLHFEDETRALSILLDDTPRHTRQVLRTIAGHYSGARAADNIDLRPWHAYQRWLTAEPCEVVLPFSDVLAQAFKGDANRSKRDFEQLLTAVAVSALMHRTRRGCDAGHVIATIEDYANARRFLHKALSETTGAAIPPSVRETVHAVLAEANGHVFSSADRTHACGAKLHDIALRLGIDKAAASRRVATAKSLGYIADFGHGNGFPSRLVVVRQPGADPDMLPEPAHVAAMFEEQHQSPEPAPSDIAPRSAPRPAVAAALPAPQPPPPIIANAPRADQPDGGYRSRRPIFQFREAMEHLGKQ